MEPYIDKGQAFSRHKKEAQTMKNTKRLLSALLIVALLAVSLSGCYIVSGQKMRAVKGTYKLTTYTYTPSHERKNGYTPTTYDYVNGEKYMYEDYLIVTGTSTGYYVHTEAGGDNYVKEVTLRYEYDTEDSSKVNYVIYNDSISVNSDDGGTHRLGVNKDSFNYSKSAINYTQLITKKEMSTEAITVRWEKVSKATDLSYISEQLGELKYYEYAAFAKRGVYELTADEDCEQAPLYTFYVIDTAKGKLCVTLYTATSAGEPTVERLEISADESLDTLTFDGATWSADMYGGYTASGALLTKVSSDITEAAIERLIADRLPEDTE